MFRGIPERRTYDLNFIQVKRCVRGTPLNPKSKSKSGKANEEIQY